MVLRAASGTRTHDLFVTNEMLYRLSYCGLWDLRMGGIPFICIAKLTINFEISVIRKAFFTSVHVLFGECEVYGGFVKI